MSTRSRIGIKREDGSIESIYCHWNSYIEYNGAMLYENYQDINKIHKLIDLGNISVLNEETEQCEDIPSENVTISYMRDRNEINEEKIVHKDLKEFNEFMKGRWEEYVYLYDETNQEWIYSVVPYSFETLGFTSLKERF